ncbi:hypothetical protein [Chryseobacterium oryctis]|uniref:Lipoprotein n=1 Tax=Chryseobacterium oryctis TaxID=2952618 RepID=A0ABT3HNL6_9FLAO|nr:hypothetical protein [Chryseobacterium oryctis]MCW3161376.1 hypothetical protein [Chryseobacterium oryctis]
MEKLTRILISLFLFFILTECNSTKYSDKFSKLENENFTYFKGYSITYRNGVYLVSNANVEKDDERIFVKKGITGKIKNIKNRNNNFITKSETEIKSLEKLLDKFDKLDIANLSVDNFQNIQFAFFLDKCSYTFLRLSDTNSLKDVNKTYFEKYKKDWYLYKQCSE